MLKKTKIVATVGPASEKEEILRQMIINGVNVFRLNFSHGTHEYHKKNLDTIRRVAKELHTRIGILQDISGPKIRTGELKEPFELKKGDRLDFYRETILGEKIAQNHYKISINQKSILDMLKIDEYIYLYDGSIRANEAFALLFPMEKIFEDYVAYMLKKVNPAQDIKVQNNGKYLISKNDENCFMLKPDLYIENKMILDTKWKIPNDSENEKKQGIEQSDLYQMFAYACKFKIYDIKLVYPLCEKTQDLQRKIAEKFFVFKASEHLYFKEQGQKDIKVQVFFAPLPF